MPDNIQQYEFKLIDKNANKITINVIYGNYPLKPYLSVYDRLSGFRIIPYNFCLQYLKRFPGNAGFTSKHTRELKQKFIEIIKTYDTSKQSDISLHSLQTYQSKLKIPLTNTEFLQLQNDELYTPLIIDLDNKWFNENKRRELIRNVAIKICSHSNITSVEQEAYKAIINDKNLPLKLEGKSYELTVSNDLDMPNILTNDALNISIDGRNIIIGFNSATDEDKLSNRLLAKLCLSQAELNHQNDSLEFDKVFGAPSEPSKLQQTSQSSTIISDYGNDNALVAFVEAARFELTRNPSINHKIPKSVLASKIDDAILRQELINVLASDETYKLSCKEKFIALFLGKTDLLDNNQNLESLTAPNQSVIEEIILQKNAFNTQSKLPLITEEIEPDSSESKTFISWLKNLFNANKEDVELALRKSLPYNANPAKIEEFTYHFSGLWSHAFIDKESIETKKELYHTLKQTIIRHIKQVLLNHLGTYQDFTDAYKMTLNSFAILMNVPHLDG